MRPQQSMTVATSQKGWHLTEAGLSQCGYEREKNPEIIIKNALNSDLRDVGAKWLTQDLLKGKLDYIKGPVVLQIVKMKNIATPKENEDSDFTTRMIKFILTDGHLNCIAVETEILKNLSVNTIPGSKILLNGTVEVESNILLLNNKNTFYLGGKVDKLSENWALKKSIKDQKRCDFGLDGGPPQYVPYGQNIPIYKNK